MAGISGRNTRPELSTRHYLHSRGFRFRLHVTDLPGKPDIVLSKYRAAVFVNGCFWHAHEGCRYFKVPASRREFWTEKLNGNRERDTRNVQTLIDMGWRVALVWECSLREGVSGLEQLCAWLTSDTGRFETPASGATCPSQDC